MKDFLEYQNYFNIRFNSFENIDVDLKNEIRKHYSMYTTKLLKDKRKYLIIKWTLYIANYIIMTLLGFMMTSTFTDLVNIYAGITTKIATIAMSVISSLYNIILGFVKLDVKIDIYKQTLIKLKEEGIRFLCWKTDSSYKRYKTEKEACMKFRSRLNKIIDKAVVEYDEDIDKTLIEKLKLNDDSIDLDMPKKGSGVEFFGLNPSILLEKELRRTEMYPNKKTISTLKL